MIFVLLCGRSQIDLHAITATSIHRLSTQLSHVQPALGALCLDADQHEMCTR